MAGAIDTSAIPGQPPNPFAATVIETLKKRAEFLALRKAPRTGGGSILMQGELARAKNGGGKGCQCNLRVGYTVTKRIGNAVVRNRIRRRLRNAVARAAARPDLAEISGNIVIIAGREALNETFDTLTAKIAKGIDRLAAKGNKAGETKTPTGKTKGLAALNKRKPV